MVINQDIADKLREIAALLEEQAAGPFRVNAYRRAVSAVDNLDGPITEIAEHKGLPGLIALPGIGEGIARSIYEYVAMGRIRQAFRAPRKVVAQGRKYQPYHAYSRFHEVSFGLTAVESLS